MTVEAMLKLAERVGVPTLFAILLLWALLFKAPSATAADVAALASRVEAHATVGNTYNERTVRFLYLMCLNTARTQASRDACEAAIR